MRKTTKRQLPALGMETSPSALDRPAIVHMPIASIIPDPSNPRKHSRQQIRAIARSIEKFGFVTPIGVDRENKIVFGHGRLEAARLCGHKDVPVVRLDHLTEEQAKALMLADNKLAKARAGIEGKLAIVLKELSDRTSTSRSRSTGFETPEIDRLLRISRPAGRVDGGGGRI